jgi:hypothetical protein
MMVRPLSGLFPDTVMDVCFSNVTASPLMIVALATACARAPDDPESAPAAEDPANSSRDRSIVSMK